MVALTDAQKAALAATTANLTPAQKAALSQSGMTGDQKSAFDMLRDMLTQFGLPANSDVMDVIKQSAINGDSTDVTQIALQNTQTWKTRFAGNEARRQAGLPVLSVAEYLSMEKQYADILHSAGLPTGFYDDPTDFSNFIGKSVSPAEVQDRVNIASDIANREDPAIRQALAERGLNQGQLVAYVLDPNRAAPIIKRDLTAAKIGAAAIRGGLSVGIQFANQLADQGVTEQQAVAGMSQATDLANSTGKLGQVYGVNYTAQDALGEVFGGNGQAAQKRQQLSNQDKAQFGGSSQYGVNKSNTTGSY